jgi:hypothetical protein
MYSEDCWRDSEGSRTVRDSTEQCKRPRRAAAAQSLRINRLDGNTFLRTKGSWVRILPGAPLFRYLSPQNQVLLPTVGPMRDSLSIRLVIVAPWATSSSRQTSPCPSHSLSRGDVAAKDVRRIAGRMRVSRRMRSKELEGHASRRKRTRFGGLLKSAQHAAARHEISEVVGIVFDFRARLARFTSLLLSLPSNLPAWPLTSSDRAATLVERPRFIAQRMDE